MTNNAKAQLTAENLSAFEEKTAAIGQFLQVSISSIVENGTVLNTQEVYGLNALFSTLNERIDAVSDFLADCEVRDKRTAKGACHD